MQLWGKRFGAIIIDFLVISVIIWIISALLYPLIALAGGFAILNYWLLLVALFIIVYFTYLEGKYSTTFGKAILKIRVEPEKGNMGYKKALIRNLSKILWVPLIIDLLAGYVSGSSKIRYLDKIAGTNVINLAIEGKKLKKSLKEPERAV